MLSYNNKREGLNASAPHCMYLVISSQTLILKYALKNLFLIFPEAQHWQRTASLCSPPRQLSEYAGSNVSKKKKEGGRGGNTEIPPSAVQEEQSPVLSPAGKKGKEGHLFYCKHTIYQQLLHEPHILKLRLQIPVESRKKSTKPNEESGDRQTKRS